MIGGGIAGAAAAAALGRRGIAVTIVERHAGLAAGASGNPWAVVMPRLDLGEGAAALWSRAAWRHAEALLGTMPEIVRRSGVLMLARDERRAARLAAAEARAGLPPGALRLVDAAEASRLSGVPLDGAALWLPSGGLVDPLACCRRLAAGATVLTGAAVSSVVQAGVGWHLAGADGTVLLEADAVVLAGGSDTCRLAQADWLPLVPVRGQLSLVPETAASGPLRTVLSCGGYLTPSHGGLHLLGATHDRYGFDAAAWPQPVTARDHAHNLAALPPALRCLLPADAPAGWGGRAAIRCTAPDALPVVGPLPDAAGNLDAHPGLFVLTGLGSRGMVSAPLAAELLAARMLAEPWPVDRNTGAALAPMRFIERARRRADGNPRLGRDAGAVISGP